MPGWRRRGFDLDPWIFGFSPADQTLFVLAQVVMILLPGLTLTTWAARTPILVRLSAAFVCGLPVQLLGWVSGVSTGVGSAERGLGVARARRDAVA